MSSDLINSPLGISFSSALAIAADLEVSIPAARWRCAKRSRTISTGASTNHLPIVSIDVRHSVGDCRPFIADLCNLLPWILFQKCIVAFDNNKTRTRRDPDCSLHWILGRMIKARCSNTDVVFTIRRDRCSLQRFRKLDTTFCIEREWSATSLEC